MPYEVIWSDRAKEDLKRVDKKTGVRVVNKVESIRETPFSFVKRLAGVDLFSLRVGNYRVILDVQRGKLVIFVIRVGHRKGVYGNL